ncbi:zinc finger, CCHC-type containing protein, partial [Tanacetum coccineum]
LGRTAKLRIDILMFQQHHGEYLSEAWTRFKIASPRGKLRDKNTNESWEIIKNLALYDHEGWNDTKEFVKPVKAISTPQSTSKTADWRLLELEDQINFLLKGSQPTPRPSSTHIPQSYAEAPQALGTTFEARVRDYMAAHTKRIERFENAIFKQREEINDKMTKMFGLLKELTTSRAPEKVLIREEAKFPVIKNTVIEMPVKEAEKEDEDKNESNKKAGKEETTGAPSSQPAEYYMKHRINEKLIEGLVDNHRFSDSLLGARVKKIKGKTYNLSPRGTVYEAILRKKITRKKEIGGNFKIPCNIRGLKHMNALVDQGSDVNVMPLSTYMKLNNERHAETDNRLSLASHSYIYLLGIAEDVLVEVDDHVNPGDFMILDIKEDEKRPFFLGTPFLTTTKAVIKFDKGTIPLRSGKSKIIFHRIPESLCKIERGVKKNIEPIAPTMTVNRLVMEWEERIKLHLEREMDFDQWKRKRFKGKHPALFKVEGGIDDEGEVTKAHLLKDKKIPSVGVFDEVFITWMVVGENTCDLGSFGEETNKITDLHQIHEEVLFTKRGDGVIGIKRCRRDLSSDDVRDLAMASGRGRLKEDLESSM